MSCTELVVKSDFYFFERNALTSENMSESYQETTRAHVRDQSIARHVLALHGNGCLRTHVHIHQMLEKLVNTHTLNIPARIKSDKSQTIRSDVVNDKTLFPTNVVYTTHD